MKKIISLALICFISASLIAGCGSNDTQVENNTRTPATPRENVEAPATPNVPDVPEPVFKNNNGISEEQISWLNGTFAILTVANGGDLNTFGGFEPSARLEREWKSTLDAWWGIDNKGELLSVIDELTVGLHNPGFLEEAEYYEITSMTEEEFINELQYIEDEEDILYFLTLFSAYYFYGEDAIMGWDLSRAVQLCAQGFLAGYLDFEEALEKAASIGKIIQRTFDSWEDFWDSYFYGYFYWSEDVDGLEQRIEIHEELAEKANSPLNLDWLLDLNY